MTLIHKKPDMSKLPGGWEAPRSILLEGTASVRKEEIFPESAFVLRDVLSTKDCAELINFMDSADNIASVSVHGRKDIPDDRMGSVRTTAWCEPLAQEFWKLLSPHVSRRQMQNSTATDWWQEGGHRDWQPIGISPLLRFMRYEKRGEHFSHYDAGYIYEKSPYRTLMSIVVYLTTNVEGGATRFIDDHQSHLPIWERQHDDWVRPALESEVIHAVSPQRGSVLIFDHRLCHDVQLYQGNTPRVIIRGDLIFRQSDPEQSHN